MKKYLPIVLVLIGLVLIGATLFLAMHGNVSGPAAVASGDAPQTLAGVSLSNIVTGSEAVKEIQAMHLGNFSLDDAVVATYGSNNISIWVGNGGSDSTAAGLVALMQDAITNTQTPFTPVGIYQFGRDVYALQGNNQLQFFFQAGSKVVWMSADPTLAEAALTELLKLFP